jgi:transposase
MPKQLNYTLTEAEQADIEHLIQTEKRAEVRQRATALHMLHLGYTPSQVAQVMQVRLSSLYNWHHRWRQGGKDALADRPKPGRRRKTTPTYWQALEQALAQDPSALGYLFTVWTLERLRDHLAHITGIHLSVERLRVQIRLRLASPQP